MMELIPPDEIDFERHPHMSALRLIRIVATAAAEADELEKATRLAAYIVEIAETVGAGAPPVAIPEEGPSDSE